MANDIKKLTQTLDGEANDERRSVLLKERALKYCQLSHTSKALQDLDRSSVLEPANSDTDFIRAYCYWREGDLRRARTCLDNSIRLGGNTFDSNCLSALLYSSLHEKQRALDELSKLPQNSESSKLVEIEVARELKDLGKARSLLNSLNPESFFGLSIAPTYFYEIEAKLYMDEKNYGEALKTVARAKANFPDNFHVAKIECQIHWALAEPGVALAIAEKLNADAPDEYLPLTLVGDAMFRAKKKTKALECFQASHEARPSSENDVLRLLVCFKDFRQFDEAELVVANFRAENASTPAIDLFAGAIVLSNPKSNSTQKKAACDSLTQVARNPKARFSERIPSIAYVYTFGERELARQLLEGISTDSLSEEEMHKLKEVKTALSRNANLEMR